MRVFVTGASGLIGSRLCKTLRARGDTVVGLSRGEHSGAEGVEWVRGNADDIEPWKAALGSCEAVVNLAGESVAQRWSVKARKAILDSRVGMTKAVVEAMKAASTPPPVLVSGSAIGFYGTHATADFDEDSESGAGFLADVCQQWETATEGCPSRVVHLRTGVVLSRDGGALPKMVTPLKTFAGGAIGSGKQWMSWIHIDDLVGLIIKAIDDDSISGPLNGVAPHPVTNQELTRAIGRAIKRPVWLNAPGFAMKAVFGQMAEEMLLNGQRVLPKKAQTHEFSFRYPTPEEALAALYS